MRRRRFLTHAAGVLTALVIPWRRTRAAVPGPIRSVRSGAWHDPATWDLIRVPIAGDVIVVRHALTVTTGLDLRGYGPGTVLDLGPGAELEFEGEG